MAATAPSLSVPPVDPEALDMLRELQDPGDEDLVGELIALFLETAPGRIAEMREAVARGDAPALAAAAHALKGSSLNLGARPMAALCAALERAGRDGCLEGVHATVEQLAREFDRVREVLQRRSASD